MGGGPEAQSGNRRAVFIFGNADQRLAGGLGQFDRGRTQIRAARWIYRCGTFLQLARRFGSRQRTGGDCVADRKTKNTNSVARRMGPQRKAAVARLRQAIAANVVDDGPVQSVAVL